MGSGTALTTGTVVGGSTGQDHYLLNDTGNGKLLEQAVMNSTQSVVVGTPTTPFPTTNAGKVGNPGDSDFIGWGYWNAGAVRTNVSMSNLADVHYVVGNPTPTMPTSGSITYSDRLGDSTPTFTTSGPALNTKLNNATLTANFSAQTVATTVNLLVDTTPVTIAGTGTITGASFGSPVASPTAPGSQFSGIFVGTDLNNNPARVGLVYGRDVTIGSGPGQPGRVGGAVLLGQLPQ